MVSLLSMPGTFMLFAGLMTGATIFVAFCIPETKGQPLEVILAKLGADKKETKEDKIKNISIIQEKYQETWEINNNKLVDRFICCNRGC